MLHLESVMQVGGSVHICVQALPLPKALEMGPELCQAQ